MTPGAQGQPWGPGLTSPSARAGQASAAAATAELLKKQEELNRKAEELDRRERELQHAALGGAAREWGPARAGGRLAVLKERKEESPRAWALGPDCRV